MDETAPLLSAGSRRRDLDANLFSLGRAVKFGVTVACAVIIGLAASGFSSEVANLSSLSAIHVEPIPAHSSATQGVDAELSVADLKEEIKALTKRNEALTAARDACEAKFDPGIDSIDTVHPTNASIPVTTPAQATRLNIGSACANEGGVCECSGDIVYSAESNGDADSAVASGAYALITGFGSSATCGNDAAGSDPAPGESKACWCVEAGTFGHSVPESQSDAEPESASMARSTSASKTHGSSFMLDAYVFHEGSTILDDDVSTCGEARVYYANNIDECAKKCDECAACVSFVDYHYQEPPSCALKASSNIVDKKSRNTYVKIAANNSMPYKCAYEGGVCECSGDIVYSAESNGDADSAVASGAYALITGFGSSATCGNDAAGSDPAPGESKVCWCVEAGTVTPPITVTPPNMVRYVRVGREKTKSNHWMNIAEVRVIDARGANVAKGKTVTGSSLYSGHFPHANLVDDNENTFAHTKNDDVEWFEIDLGEEYNVDRVEVVNRKSCLSNSTTAERWFCSSLCLQEVNHDARIQEKVEELWGGIDMRKEEIGGIAKETCEHLLQSNGTPLIFCFSTQHRSGEKFALYIPVAFPGKVFEVVNASSTSIFDAVNARVSPRGVYLITGTCLDMPDADNFCKSFTPLSAYVGHTDGWKIPSGYLALVPQGIKMAEMSTCDIPREVLSAVGREFDC